MKNLPATISRLCNSLSQSPFSTKLEFRDRPFDCGRTFSFQNQFFLRLLIGLRLSRINQKINANYGGGIFANGPNLQAMDSRFGYDTLFMKNNFWGIGPRIGIEPQLNLGKGFRLYSSACATLSGGFFDNIQNEVYLQNVRYNRNCSFKCFREMFDATAGFTWETLCHKDRYALAFGLGWEYHMFFKQFELVADKFGLVSHDRNLSLNGLAFSVRFDF